MTSSWLWVKMTVSYELRYRLVAKNSALHNSFEQKAMCAKKTDRFAKSLMGICRVFYFMDT